MIVIRLKVQFSKSHRPPRQCELAGGQQAEARADLEGATPMPSSSFDVPLH